MQPGKNDKIAGGFARSRVRIGGANKLKAGTVWTYIIDSWATGADCYKIVVVNKSRRTCSTNNIE